MKIINIKYNHDKYLEEYIELCHLEWGTPIKKEHYNNYIKRKKDEIRSKEKVISILALEDKNQMIGFISLFKYDGEEKRELTPWYATMYVKKRLEEKGILRFLMMLLFKKPSL